MIHFMIKREDPTYPEELRKIREDLGLSQKAFASAAGYSAVMQGRYETKRGHSNSAIPSERTAKAIQVAIAKKTLGRNEIIENDDALQPPVKSLKSVSMAEIEQAFAHALLELTGAAHKVVVKDVSWENELLPGTVISLVVGSPESN
jgi:transcriptional regulator with XRE-family HTH domain